MAKRSARKFTVPEVWRRIVKKNERQGNALYDVLICNHSVPANDNTYRRARSCPECRVAVQEYADRPADRQPESQQCSSGAPRGSPLPTTG